KSKFNFFVGIRLETTHTLIMMLDQSGCNTHGTHSTESDLTRHPPRPTDHRPHKNGRKVKSVYRQAVQARKYKTRRVDWNHGGHIQLPDRHDIQIRLSRLLTLNLNTVRTASILRIHVIGHLV